VGLLVANEVATTDRNTGSVQPSEETPIGRHTPELSSGEVEPAVCELGPSAIGVEAKLLVDQKRRGHGIARDAAAPQKAFTRATTSRGLKGLVT
jgi:hypothetical protein